MGCHTCTSETITKHKQDLPRTTIREPFKKQLTRPHASEKTRSSTPHTSCCWCHRSTPPPSPYDLGGCQRPINATRAMAVAMANIPPPIPTPIFDKPPPILIKPSPFLTELGYNSLVALSKARERRPLEPVRGATSVVEGREDCRRPTSNHGPTVGTNDVGLILHGCWVESANAAPRPLLGL